MAARCPKAVEESRLAANTPSCPHSSPSRSRPGRRKELAHNPLGRRRPFPGHVVALAHHGNDRNLLHMATADDVVLPDHGLHRCAYNSTMSLAAADLLGRFSTCLAQVGPTHRQSSGELSLIVQASVCRDHFRVLRPGTPIRLGRRKAL